MSPIVPPNSMMQTSGSVSSSVTGTLATFSTHSWMASVMCGTTTQRKGETLITKAQNQHCHHVSLLPCTVFPR